MNTIIIGIKNDIPFVISNLNRDITVKSIFCIDDGNFSLESEIHSNDFITADYIILAIYSRKNEEQAVRFLTDEIIGNKVIDFYSVATALTPQMTADRVMKNPKYKSYDAIWLGLSHAEVGIVPTLMNGAVANLAASSQDIYYNYQVLKYCCENYPDKMRAIKKIYIDMFDYTYFNFDTSLSSVFLSYISLSGGIFLPHNQAKSLNCKIPFDKKLKDFIYYLHTKNVTERQLDIWNEIFGHSRMGYPEYLGYYNKPFLELRNQIFNPDEAASEAAMRLGLSQTRHQDTIIENKKLFSELLEYIAEIDKNIEVKLIIMPQHKAAAEQMTEEMLQWKKEFYSTIDEFKDLYDFRFLDMRYYPEISDRDDYFFDIEHLNYAGAVAFTEKINEGLIGI